MKGTRVLEEIHESLESSTQLQRIAVVILYCYEDGGHGERFNELVFVGMEEEFV